MTGCGFTFPMTFDGSIVLLSGPVDTAAEASRRVREAGYAVLTERADPELGVWPEEGLAFLRVSASEADGPASALNPLGWRVRFATDEGLQ